MLILCGNYTHHLGHSLTRKSSAIQKHQLLLGTHSAEANISHASVKLPRDIERITQGFSVGWCPEQRRQAQVRNRGNSLAPLTGYKKMGFRLKYSRKCLRTHVRKDLGRVRDWFCAYQWCHPSPLVWGAIPMTIDRYEGSLILLKFQPR